MQHSLKTSLPRVLSRYAQSDNARRRAVKGEVTAFGVVPVPFASPVSTPRSRKKKEEKVQEETESGALGQLRHLFEQSQQSPGRSRPLLHSSSSWVLQSQEIVKDKKGNLNLPTFANWRHKHARLRFPRLAEKAGYDEELHRRTAALAAGRRRDIDSDDEEEERFLDTFSNWIGSSALSLHSSQRALRQRRLGPSPRPAILRRQDAVPPVSIGTTSTFHISEMDMGPILPNPMEQSTTSLFSAASSRHPPPSTSSWAPSMSASSQAAVDRKWLSRVAPISCLPSGANTSAVRSDLLDQERQRLSSKKSGRTLRTQKTIATLDALSLVGSAGGYLSFENCGLTDDYLEALLEAHDGLGQETNAADVPTGLVGVKHIHLGGNLLTERGLKALVSAEGPTETLKTLTLTSNRLGLEGRLLCECLWNLERLTELDLSCNPLGDSVTAELCKALVQGCPQLQGLGLARCRIGSQSTTAVAGAALGHFVAQSSTLKVLDLAWNALHGEAAEALLEGIYDNNKAADARESGGLRRLGIAWNRLGSKATNSQTTRSAKLLCSIFEDCKAMFHMDLSYNGFGAEDCAVMAAGLAKNHTLFGLHLVGNEATVDDFGFIVPFKGGKVSPGTYGDDTSSVHRYLRLAGMLHAVPRKLQLSHPTDISSSGEACRPSTGMRLNPSLLFGDQSPSAVRSISTARLPSASKDRLEAENNWAREKCRVHAIGVSLEEEAEAQQFNAKCCWICENWCEYRMTFSKKTGKSEAKTVYALTSLDGFSQPIQLKQLGNQWSASKMLPPSLSAVEVIFIVDGKLEISNSHPVRNLIAKKTVILTPDIFGVNEEQGSVPNVVETEAVNTINAGFSAIQRLRLGEPAALCILESANDRSQVEVLPRQIPEKLVVAKTEAKTRVAWTFETSTFRHYLRDLKSKPDECFDRDWSLCKAQQLIKNESTRRELAGMLRHEYMKWILAFWYAAMIDFQSHRYAVGLSCNSWRELLLRTEGSSAVFLIDDVSCKSSDLDCIYVAANTLDKDKRKTLSVLPDKALARFQFLEAVVRLAFKRFLRAGPANSSAEDMKGAIDALQEVLHLGEECFEKRRTLHECLFTEECCLVYRDFQEHLKVIYEGFTSVSSYPGRRGRILSFGGWLTLCGQAMPEEPSTRLFREAFALGREIRVDETSHYRHMELAWPEFLVSLGALQRLQPDYDPEFFADSLSTFFQTLIALSDSLLAGNPATAGRKVGNSKDQALLQLIAHIFQEADDDETGTIDETEFRTFFEQPKVHEQLKEHGISMSNLNMIFKSMDADGQGLLTFDELCDGFLKMASIMRSNERAISYIRKVFAESDEDGSGTLNKEEFNHIFDEPSVKKKMESFGIFATDLEDLFSLIDEDGSGQVSEDEVVAGFVMLRDPKTAGERGVAILSKIFEEADYDGSGSLDKFEYVTAFSEEHVTQQLLARNLKVPDWEGLFEVLDADGSGTLQWDELREGLVSFWARHQMDEIRK